MAAEPPFGLLGGIRRPLRRLDPASFPDVHRRRCGAAHSLQSSPFRAAGLDQQSLDHPADAHRCLWLGHLDPRAKGRAIAHGRMVRMAMARDAPYVATDCRRMPRARACQRALGTNRGAHSVGGGALDTLATTTTQDRNDIAGKSTRQSLGEGSRTRQALKATRLARYRSGNSLSLKPASARASEIGIRGIPSEFFSHSIHARRPSMSPCSRIVSINQKTPTLCHIKEKINHLRLWTTL